MHPDAIAGAMEYAYYSRYEEYDLLCWIGVGDLLDLKRCLSAVLQKEKDNICNPKANPANIDAFRSKQGPSSGITDFVFNPLGE